MTLIELQREKYGGTGGKEKLVKLALQSNIRNTTVVLVLRIINIHGYAVLVSIHEGSFAL